MVMSGDVSRRQRLAQTQRASYRNLAQWEQIRRRMEASKFKVNQDALLFSVCEDAPTEQTKQLAALAQKMTLMTSELLKTGVAEAPNHDA
jgi:hypothetical protein